MENLRVAFDFSSLSTKSIFVAALITWSIAKMFTSEKGPLEIFEKLRTFVGLERLEDDTANYTKGGLYRFLATLLECLWCLSLWVGWLIAFFCFPERWFLLGFLLRGLSILIDVVVEALVRFKKWGANNG